MKHIANVTGRSGSLSSSSGSVIPTTETRKPLGLKCGYLYKCSLRFKRWRQCWFVLDWKDIAYYEDQFDHAKNISLKNHCSVLEAEADDVKRPNSFKVAIQTRTFILSADSRENMESWIHAIRAISGLHSTVKRSV
eukprot:TRINITY_DN10213_c0_g1_i1.p1 TRINITY_DN10213_c0_g1~~TRINITY_DN10213_c0_g1_i1.p1  ORF type:complete len:136 (-),score=27.79 TRINITY_DN10213_c0_g1_i1:103-510(-)